MPSTVPRRRRGRVLIAEDDPDAAFYLMYVLGRRGPFSCVHAADPAAALVLAARSAWDLAVIDLDLPGMTGFELLAALRRVAPSVPVIIVSAHDPALLDRALLDPALPAPAGVGPRPDAFLAKPVPAALLLATALALRAAAQEAEPGPEDGPGEPRLSARKARPHRGRGRWGVTKVRSER